MRARRAICGAPAGVFLSLAVLAFLVALAVGCGTPMAAPPGTEPAATDAPTTVPPTIVELAAPIDTALSAPVRLNPPTTQIEVAQEPPDPSGQILTMFAHLPCVWYAPTAATAGWTLELIPKMLRTMFRESRCLPWVRSTTSDSGLLQINDIVLRDWRFKRDWPEFDPATLFDPPVNLAVAWWLFNIDGWTPWRGGA